jgi:beta-galactosidase
MRVIFGVKHKSFTMVREPGSIPRWSPPERTWGEFIESTVLTGKGPLNGIALRANVYIETFEISGSSTPCFMYNNAVAGVVNKVGKNNGSAWLLGTYMGHTGTAYRSEVNQNIVRSLLSQCGVPLPPVGSPLLRKRAIPGKEAWIYTNPSGAEMTAKVDVKGWPSVHDLLGEPLDRQGDMVNLRVNSLDVRVLIVKK